MHYLCIAETLETRDSEDIRMRGTDGDKTEAGDNMATKEANLHKEPVLYNFDVSQPLIGPVPAKVCM